MRDARTAWTPLSSLLTTSPPHNLNIYAKQITHLEADPANHHHRAYRHRHYFWGAVVPVTRVQRTEYRVQLPCGVKTPCKGIIYIAKGNALDRVHLPCGARTNALKGLHYIAQGNALCSVHPRMAP